MKDNKRVVYRAGVIPYMIQEGALKMLFMKPADPKYGGDTFQIAKGKIDPGEDAQQAALREGKEELGLFVGNIEKLESLGGPMLGRTYFYVAEIKDETMFGDAHFETGETRWMSESEFMRVGRDLHKPVVKAAIRLIRELEK